MVIVSCRHPRQHRELQKKMEPGRAVKGVTGQRAHGDLGFHYAAGDQHSTMMGIGWHSPEVRNGQDCGSTYVGQSEYMPQPAV